MLDELPEFRRKVLKMIGQRLKELWTLAEV